jgi:hypothetical protein
LDRKDKGDRVNNRNNPKYNSEGYADPTAYLGTKDVIKVEQEADKRAYDLIHVLKYIVRQSGFELIERVQVRDKQSRREYR